MSHAKSFLFKKEERKFSAFCKALAHPARRRIVDMLITDEVIPFGRLCCAIPLHPATVQEHLIKLRMVHLIHVCSNDRGDVIGYRLNDRGKREMDRLFRQFLGESGVVRVA